MSDQSRHHALCDTAAGWLSGTMRCNVVLAGITASQEHPDAIGWSTSWKHHGSIVVECKTSLSDFRRDQKKRYRRFKGYTGSWENKDLEAQWEEMARMGDRRYFLCPPGVITLSRVEQAFPDHGLLYARGANRVSIIREAPLREKVEHLSEVRLLQFALLHLKQNLLAAGLTVNMRELTKHPMIADRGDLLEGFLKVKRFTTEAERLPHGGTRRIR